MMNWIGSEQIMVVVERTIFKKKKKKEKRNKEGSPSYYKSFRRNFHFENSLECHDTTMAKEKQISEIE